MNSASNLRKAAVLIRSLDADTATGLLGQLSSEEAAAIHTAIRALGPIDPEEQADVLAEFRRTRPLADLSSTPGVELTLSSELDAVESSVTGTRRFDFLEQAPIESLVPYLAREHAQTIAVVLSQLAPGRAASVLAALPEKLQAAAIERLIALGETDPESVTALERELAGWVAKHVGARAVRARRGDTISAILAAADAKARAGILSNLKTHNAALADRIAPLARDANRFTRKSQKPTRRSSIHSVGRRTEDPRLAGRRERPAPSSQRSARRPIDFDHLIHLDGRTLAAVLRQSDPNVLALALAGSRDDLVDRICDQMPKRTARAFRRQLRRLGPTRLSDVEAAQRVVADHAAQQLEARRRDMVA